MSALLNKYLIGKESLYRDRDNPSVSVLFATELVQYGNFGNSESGQFRYRGCRNVKWGCAEQSRDGYQPTPIAGMIPTNLGGSISHISLGNLRAVSKVIESLKDKSIENGTHLTSLVRTNCHDMIGNSELEDGIRLQPTHFAIWERI